MMSGKCRNKNNNSNNPLISRRTDGSKNQKHTINVVLIIYKIEKTLGQSILPWKGVLLCIHSSIFSSTKDIPIPL